MKEYFLKVNNDGSLNGAYLSVWENGVEKVLIQSIKEATNIVTGKQIGRAHV